MSVYFVTGKLGSGKTLAAVDRIRQYLLAGRVVATNLDLNLRFLVGPFSRCNVVRVPDKPTVFDLECLGKGNDSYNEERNGLLVLDECGTWFNSRSWNDKERQKLIDWCLHARKLGWDIIFIIQDVGFVDKQARQALAEHVVYCRRTDRLKVPLVGSLMSLLGERITLPRFHLGIVKYGDSPSSLTVDRWWYRGDTLFRAYDTKQAFLASYAHGAYCVLPPFFTARGVAERNRRFYMRLTRLWFRRYSRVFALGVGLAAGLLLAAGIRPSFGSAGASVPDRPAAAAPSSRSGSVATTSPSSSVASSSTSSPATSVSSKGPDFVFSGSAVTGSASTPDGRLLYLSVTDGAGRDFSLAALRNLGFVVVARSSCQVVFLRGPGLHRPRSVYASYCPPDPHPAPSMNAAEARQYRWEQFAAQARHQVHPVPRQP